MKPTQHQRIVAAINEKIGERKLVCPVSGHTNSWEVSISSGDLPAVESPGTSAVPGGPAFPLAVVFCKECGYTFFMNLVTLGLAEELGIRVPVNE